MMQINTLGEVLKYYRKKYNLSQECLCEGICTLTTLSRLEKGERLVDSLVAESLLGRIGQEVLQFEVLLNDEDYQLWLTRQEIQNLIRKGNYYQAKERLASYRKIMPQEEAVHRQFCLYQEAQLSIREQADTKDICEMLYQAFHLTKQEMKTGAGQPYNPTETALVVLLIHYGYSGWRNMDKERILLERFYFVDEIYSGKQKERTGREILKELIRQEEQEKKYEQVITHVDKAVDFISRGRGMNYIAEFHFIKAKAMAQLYRGKDWEIRKHVCKEECLMAYYVFDIFKQEEEKQQVQQFCEEKLGWQIIE